MKSKLLFCALLAAPWPAFAMTNFTVNGITYNELSQTTAEVTNTYQAISGKETALIIPENVIWNGQTYNVISIGERAISNSVATTVDIPATIQNIGLHCFVNSKKLTAINVSGSNKNYSSVDGVLFTRDMTKLIAYPAGHHQERYNIPSTVKTVEEDAFSNAQFLKSVYLGNVEQINQCGFYAMPSLEQMHIDSQVKNIGNYAFGDCTNLAELYIMGAKQPLSIERNTFIGTGNLKKLLLYRDVTINNSDVIPINNWLDISSLIELTIGDKLSEIPELSFKGCTTIETVNIYPARNLTIGANAFFECTGIKQVNGSSILSWLLANFTNEYSNPMSNNGTLSLACPVHNTLDIPEGVREVQNYTFLNNSFKTILLPSTIEKIGEKAFYSDKNKGFWGNVIVRSDTPPTAFDNSFSETQYETYFLNIPQITPNKFHEAPTCWSKFKYYSEEHRVDYIYINYEKILAIGDSLKITANIVPAGAPNDGIIWSSSNYMVASVDNDGVVLALSEGEAEIAAQSLDNRDCPIFYKVKVIPRSEINLTIKYADNGDITIPIAYNSASEIKINAAEGWKANCVTLNGENLEIGENDLLHLPPLSDDSELYISFIGVTTFTNPVSEDLSIPKIIPQKGSISILNVQRGTYISIQTIGGIVTHNFTADHTEFSIDLAPGIYIVNIGAETFKLKL